MAASRWPGFIYITCAENGLYGLEHLGRRGIRPKAVVSLPPGLGERYKISGYRDVGPFCRGAGVPLILLESYALEPRHLNGIEFDLIVVNGWNRLISAEVIRMARLGGLGVHAGHPPIGLGRAPLVWNILLGRRDIEVYVFGLTERADDGAIHARRTVEITPFDTVRLLYEKVMQAGADLFVDAVERLAEGVPGEPQAGAFTRAYGKRSAEDGIIDFCASETEIYDFIRSQGAPYPGAFAMLDGEKWVFDRAVPFDRFAYRDRPRLPGEVLGALPSGLVIATGGSPIWLLEARAGNVRKVPAPLRDLESLVGLCFHGVDTPRVQDGKEST